MALGAAAPEPQSRGLGVTYCAELRDNAAERTASVLSSVLASYRNTQQQQQQEGGGGSSSSGSASSALPSPQLKEILCSAVSLLLQLQTWANAPMSAAECRAAMQNALKRLTPLCDANRSKFNDATATAQMLMSLLCGSTSG